MVDFWVSWAGVGDRGLVAVKNFKKGVKLLFVPPSLVITSDLEGSATDSRVLRDAITRHNGLKVPFGNYYLADAGYTNGHGFLAPYRVIRMYMSVDPEEYTPITLDDLPIGEDYPNELESIDVIGGSDEWSQWRDDLAREIFDAWMSRRT
ncbi:hypothetical protein LWI29_025751 [Acer saccharum]|uniref:DDE Tnp4 domain-containing protein n=1 Tax=Acer saccharum TaxID=4024 RepID=A0AA39SK46_ACESA|nr:hypothetical protein LWI29_025751 [Acer saccharum]